jgi:hypothetical protein
MSRARGTRHRANNAILGTIVGVSMAAAAGGLANLAHDQQDATPTSTGATPAIAASLFVPDPTLHPGAINTTLTKAKLCSSTFHTSSVRPPTSYTNKLKVLEIGNGGTITAPNGVTYTVKGEHLPGVIGDYELDHLISLEIGGNPTDPKNLWLEPWEHRGSHLAPAGSGAETKDHTENALHAEVCANKRSLKSAQQAIAKDWTTAK